MPPVLGPASPSKIRLWSWLVASGRTFLPSTMTMKLASSPAMKSSIKTRAPGVPGAVSENMWSMARCASASVVATTTPLPAASPSALMTIGAPLRSRQACAASASVKVSEAAVGIWCRAMKRLAKSLELSSCAAARVGPKIFSPWARKRSTMPAASGASGPTTVRWIFSRSAKSASAVRSVSGRFSIKGA